jgi:hypothetical protein
MFGRWQLTVRVDRPHAAPSSTGSGCVYSPSRMTLRSVPTRQ